MRTMSIMVDYILEKKTFVETTWHEQLNEVDFGQLAPFITS